MIFAFIGKQRNGKTLMMNKIARYYQKQDYVIISNQRNLGYPHIYFDPKFMESKEGIEDIKRKMSNPNIIMCLDEAHLWVDSRRSGKNAAKSFLISQAGKLLSEQGHFMYTTQYFGQIDIRLRYNTNYIFEVKKFMDEGEEYFEIITYEPNGERAYAISKTRFSAKELYEDDLYDRFEMVDVIE